MLVVVRVGTLSKSFSTVVIFNRSQFCSVCVERERERLGVISSSSNSSCIGRMTQNDRERAMAVVVAGMSDTE